MLREINLKDALEKLLEEKPVLAAPISRKENPEKRRYTFRSLNEILSRYRFLAEDDLTKKKFSDFLETTTEAVQEEENTQIAPPSARQEENNMRDEEGYTGFLHICCECGCTKSFCIKNKIKEFKCEKCGRTMELKGLRRAYINCECGSNFKYYTNETAEMFDLEYLNCEQPVALKYNEKKKIYETIKD